MKVIFDERESKDHPWLSYLPQNWEFSRVRLDTGDLRIIDWTLHRKPTDGSTHWSSRKLGSALGTSHMRVASVWAKAGLQPHRRRHYMVMTRSLRRRRPESSVST
jgi:hypothetical protein